MAGMQCSVIGCHRKHSARQMCALHYERWRKSGSTAPTKHARHGHKGPVESPTHKSWRSIIGRCCNPKDRSYFEYGARGITVCARWRDSFPAFLADMGERPPRFSIDRIDRAKGYEPSNCRWADTKTQQRNRSCTKLVTFQGSLVPLGDIADSHGVGYGILSARLERGWTIDRALATPVPKPRHVEFDGVALTVTQWARKLGINTRTLANRLTRGWSIKRALSEGVRSRK